MHHAKKNPTEERIFPLPLVIGVTGHRELREEDRVPLAAVVRKVFNELKSICPHTPLLLLSSLAEGADRLVAEVALEKGYMTRFHLSNLSLQHGFLQELKLAVRLIRFATKKEHPTKISQLRQAGCGGNCSPNSLLEGS